MAQRHLKHYIRLLTLLIGSVIISSCGKDRSDEYYELIGSKKWIHETMLSNYLFKDEVPTDINPSKLIGTEPTALFTELLSDKDGKTIDGVVHYYSHLDSVNGSASRALVKGVGFGFEYQIYLSDNVYFARVLYVEPNSPAQRAGLERGDFVVKINGQPITSALLNNYIVKPIGACKYTLGEIVGKKMEITRDVEMPAPEIIVRQTLLKDSVFMIGEKKVAYLLYTMFDSDDLEHTVSVMNRIVEEQPEEIILDLRYNPGGYVTLAQMMGTYFASSDMLDKIFFKSNPGGDIYKFEKRKYNFTSREQSYSITDKTLQNLKHLFVLTSQRTASSSEIIINGLRPYFNTRLQQVGEKTFGKNVMQTLFTNADYPVYEMWLTTDYIANSKDHYEYSGGLEPDYEVAEDLEADLAPFGAKEDALLRPVLHFIEYGSYPEAINMSSSRSNSEKMHTQWKLVYNSLDKYQPMAIK